MSYDLRFTIYARAALWLALLLSTFGLLLSVPAQGKFPIRNGVMQSDLNAAGFSLTNVGSITDTNGNPITGGSSLVFTPTNQPPGFLETNGNTVFYGTNVVNQVTNTMSGVTLPAAQLDAPTTTNAQNVYTSGNSFVAGKADGIGPMLALSDDGTTVLLTDGGAFDGFLTYDQGEPTQSVHYRTVQSVSNSIVAPAVVNALLSAGFTNIYPTNLPLNTIVIGGNREVYLGTNYSTISVNGSQLVAASVNTNKLDAATMAWLNSYGTALRALDAFDVVATFGAVGNGSTDDTAALQGAASSVARTNGTPRNMFLRYGNYKLTSEVLFNGTTGTDLPQAASGAGDYTVLGNSAKITSHSPTNALRIYNNMRMVTLKEFAMVGTNVTRASNANHVGIIMDGPNGHLTLDSLNIQQFTVGILGDDITDLDIRNVWLSSNFVGLASSYKPDNWRVHGRFERSSYGVFLSYTNSEFTTDSGLGWPEISGTLGHNRVGILVPKGGASIGPIYSEGNTHCAIQLGMDVSNPYEANYGNDGTAPQVRVRGWDCNGADVIRAYRASTVWMENCHPGYFTVRLENAAADGSTVESDATAYVRRSDGTTLTIGNGIRYVNGALVPISKMSWTNLTDVAVGTGLQYSNATLSVNLEPWAAAYWKLDEASGTRYDSVGVNHLNFTGDDYEIVGGKVGNAVTNYGVYSTLETSASTNLSYRGPWTAGGWFQVANVNDARTLVGKSNEFAIYYSGFAVNRMRVAFGNADLLINESWSAVAPNGTTSLKFVCAWWDGTTLYAQASAGTIYSTNLSTSGGAITPPTPVSSPFIVAQVVGDTSLAVADEVFFARRVLSAGERAALYNSGNGSALVQPKLYGDTSSLTIPAANVTGLSATSYAFSNDTNAVGVVSVAGTNVTVGTNLYAGTNAIFFTHSELLSSSGTSVAAMENAQSHTTVIIIGYPIAIGQTYNTPRFNFPTARLNGRTNIMLGGLIATTNATTLSLVGGISGKNGTNHSSFYYHGSSYTVGVDHTNSATWVDLTHQFVPQTLKDDGIMSGYFGIAGTATTNKIYILGIRIKYW